MTLTYNRVLKLIALVLLVLAALVGLGWVTFIHDAFLLPGGLAFWCASEV